MSKARAKPDDEVLSRREVARLMPFFATNLWFTRAELAGTFPRRMRQGGRLIYLRKAVEMWIADYLAKAAAAEQQEGSSNVRT